MIKTAIWFLVLSLLGTSFYLVVTNVGSILNAFVGLPLDYIGILLLGAAVAFLAMWLTQRTNNSDD